AIFGSGNHRNEKADMTTNGAITELNSDDALEFLGPQKLGRLAMVLAGDPEIVPASFVLHPGGEGTGTIYIQPAAANTLLAAAVGRTLAFEVDEASATDAASVIAYGNGRIVKTTEEADRAYGLGLKSWVATHKPAIIAIDITRISG